MTERFENDLESLVGAEMSSVCFVRDYVELHFDGPLLRLIGEVSINGIRMRLDNLIKPSTIIDHYSVLTALLNGIGSIIKEINTADEGLFGVVFEDGLTVMVTPKGHGEEYLHYVSYPDNRLTVLAG